LSKEKDPQLCTLLYKFI